MSDEYELVRRAEAGEASAQFELGVMYQDGAGVKKDAAVAASYYRQAAEQGHAPAQNRLGVLYEDGKGVKRDYSKAAFWYGKAAEQGDATAQYNLGSCYERGTGVDEIAAKAIFWYRKSAAQGDSDAKSKLQALSRRQKVIVRTYSGSQSSATQAFQADAANLAKKGYFPASQTWAPGEYGCGCFLMALLLCVLIIGILVFIYMLIVKPEGTLTVSYELRELLEEKEKHAALIAEKTCPQCAEQVKAAAKVCRFCSHNFEED